MSYESISVLRVKTEAMLAGQPSEPSIEHEHDYAKRNCDRQASICESARDSKRSQVVFRILRIPLVSSYRTTIENS